MPAAWTWGFLLRPWPCPRVADASHGGGKGGGLTCSAAARLSMSGVGGGPCDDAPIRAVRQISNILGPPLIEGSIHCAALGPYRAVRHRQCPPPPPRRALCAGCSVQRRRCPPRRPRNLPAKTLFASSHGGNYSTSDAGPARNLAEPHAARPSPPAIGIGHHPLGHQPSQQRRSPEHHLRGQRDNRRAPARPRWSETPITHAGGHQTRRPPPE